MGDIAGMLGRPEMAVLLGVLAAIIVMLVAIMVRMRQREREQNRWFGEVENAIYNGLSEDYGDMDAVPRAQEEAAEQAARAELMGRLDGLRDEIVRESERAMSEKLDAALSGIEDRAAQRMERAVSEQLRAALGGLSDELARLGGRLDGLKSATDELKLLRQRLSVAPRGDMSMGQLDVLLMQWLAPGRYVRDFEVGTGSGRYADVAILLPDETDKALYLPVDMSFPVEEFAGEWDEEARARLSRRLVEHATRLSEELIRPGLTTDFVIMLLRSELVCARAGDMDAALASAQLSRQVVVVGPAMFWSMARALDGGVSALELRRSARKLEQLMDDMRGEMGQFAHMLDAGDEEYCPRRRLRAAQQGADDGSDALMSNVAQVEVALNGVPEPEQAAEPEGEVELQESEQFAEQKSGVESLESEQFAEPESEAESPESEQTDEPESEAKSPEQPAQAREVGSAKAEGMWSAAIQAEVDLWS